MNQHPEVKLNELYQEVILDHNRRPRNFGKLATANKMAHGKNPLCGDEFFVYLDVDATGKIQKIAFEGQGCAISKASASMMTDYVEGKSSAEAEKMKEHFIQVLTAPAVNTNDLKEVGRLKIFEGVRQFPVRVKCAALAWRTLEAALKDTGAEVSTEK